MMNLLVVPVATYSASKFHMNVFDLVANSGWVGKFVLLSLLLASLFSWTVIFMKYRIMKKAQRESQAFLQTFWYSKDLEDIFVKSEKFKLSPVARVFKSGFKELKKVSEIAKAGDPGALDGVTNVARALNRTAMSEVNQLEKSIGFLATVGSAAPFVGLFGTVWGIMTSFQDIGASGSASLAVVAPGISEALITTAAGLAAAIPAVIAYNYYVGRIKLLASEMDTFSQDFLNIVQRSFLKTSERD